MSMKIDIIAPLGDIVYIWQYMISIDFLNASWIWGWRENWVFWLLSITMLSLMYVVTLPFPGIYQSILSPYQVYIPLPSIMKMTPPVLRSTPITTGNLSPEKKMVYAFWVEWDNSTLTSLIQNRVHIDALIMEELTITGSGIELINPSKFKRTQEYLMNHAPNLPLHILINNYNPVSDIWDRDLLYSILSNTTKRRNLWIQLRNFAIQQDISGINIDFEVLDEEIFPYYLLFLGELSSRLHRIGKILSVDVPLSDPLYNLGEIARRVDLVFVMAYDEHWWGSNPGPIASRDWFARWVRLATRSIPRDKIVIILGNYGYDWILWETGATSLTLPKIHTLIRESVATRLVDPSSANPVFYYLDRSGRDHVVWYLDASTIQHELSLLESSGIKNISLWRLGSEDPEIWNMFDRFVGRTK